MSVVFLAGALIRSDETAPAGHGASLSIGLSAVIVAASVQEPRVLTIRLPSRGEVVPGPGDFEIEVLDADPRRVKRLKI